MSKSVRLKEYLAVEVERRAADENRSFANMVERLLEQALRMTQEPLAVDAVPRDVSARTVGPARDAYMGRDKFGRKL